jgi:hydrogenase maturation protein HypF
LKKAHILIRGLVQGVGFRPFIYKIAIDNNLSGYVLNLGDAGVEVVVEGLDEKISKFINEITLKKPSVAKIESIETRWGSYEGNYKEFLIAKSDEKKLTVRSVIPTDLSICDLCITDISRNSRWKLYPFTSCAQCGPRFTVIKKLPYDRENTSMAKFPFCKYCQSEYDDPTDRRYDAQGITCPICGPKLELQDNANKIIDGNPLENAAKLLEEGSIIAIKGIGGFHIAVDASNENTVVELRTRRKRPYQPFAVMSYSLNLVKKYASVSKAEEDLLTNIYHPIVSLRKSNGFYLSESVSPGLDTVGVMLPYTGIHHLLMKYFSGDALVMTSGNYPGKPIFIENLEAIHELRHIVDYYLIHNRDIVNRCDDSVIKVVNGRPTFIRKSRGYAPSTIITPWDNTPTNVMAVGGEYNITGSIQVKDRLITTQHIGDANELETLDYLKTAFNYILKLYDINKLDIIAHDANPSFLTTRYAHELATEYGAHAIPIQHHHAHMTSLMVDHGLGKEEDIAFIAIDGVGYGTDGMAWGGEIFIGGYKDYKRVAHLKYQPMPGGDACAYYPARMLAATLSSIMSDSEVIDFFSNKYINYLNNKNEELNIILKQVKNNRVLKTSSMGRLLDTIAVLLEICGKRTYEGEPPMRLESIANAGHPRNITLRLPLSQREGKIILDTSEFIRSIIEKMNSNSKYDIAYEAHSILGRTLGSVACSICDEYGLKTIGLGGGSAINSLLSHEIQESIEQNNKNFLTYRSIPCGDGGTSCGQAISASART